MTEKNEPTTKELIKKIFSLYDGKDVGHAMLIAMTDTAIAYSEIVLGGWIKGVKAKDEALIEELQNVIIKGTAIQAILNRILEVEGEEYIIKKENFKELKHV